VGVLNLEGATVENPSGDVYRFPDLKIVCFGTCGMSVMRRLVNGFRNGISNIASDEELIPYMLDRIDRYTIPIPKKEPEMKIPSQKVQTDVIQHDPARLDTVIFVGSLGCLKDIDLLIKSAESSRKVGIHTIGVIEVPQILKNKEFVRGRDTILSKLENALDCLILSSSFKLGVDYGVNRIVDHVNAIEFMMTKAVTTIVDHYIASRNEFSGAAFTLSQLKTLVLNGSSQFGFYTVLKTQNPIEIAQNRIIRDFDIGKLKTGLLLFYADESFSWRVIDYITKAIFKHAREDATLASILTSVPSSAGEIDISLLANSF
jgi:hypothetical protein